MPPESVAARLAGIPVPEDTQQTFVARYGLLFEHSPWVAERAWQQRPFWDRLALHAALCATVSSAGEPAQLALVRAHPELAGKAAIGALTAQSRAEQTSAGLDQLSPAEFARFHELNTAYRNRFAFPFVICVRLSDKTGILSALQRRLNSDPAGELREAIEQIGLIAALRLADLPIGEPPLMALERRVREDLDTLGIPAAAWVPPPAAGTQVFDVAIIGGGQSGLGSAFGLLRDGIGNVVVLDENTAGGEGPWVSYARMLTLRTPKQLTSIDLGIPSLTYRAWHSARHGAAHWEALDKIDRTDWMEYLRWFRRVLALPVRNDVRVERVEPQGSGLFSLLLSGPEGGEAGRGGVLLARKVVFATGIQGGGEWHVPADIAARLPRRLYAHSAWPIDYSALRGKRIGILGGGASAFDNAQLALAQGVAEVHVFVRRPELARVNPIRHMERSGICRHYGQLDDARKYAVAAHFISHPQPPTNDTFNRAAAQSGFRLHMGTPWLGVEARGDTAVVNTPRGEFQFDFLVISTGTRTDLGLRPELAAFVNDIQLWGQRFQPATGTANPAVDAHPYLGPHFEFMGRDAAAQARLRGLFAFNYSALASIGLSASALSGLRFAIPKLVAGISAQLFLDDQDAILKQLFDYSEPEFQGQWQESSAPMRSIR